MAHSPRYEARLDAAWRDFYASASRWWRAWRSSWRGVWLGSPCTGGVRLPASHPAHDARRDVPPLGLAHGLWRGPGDRPGGNRPARLRSSDRRLVSGWIS